MAKFSDAFLQGLRGSGQRGSPTDPALQRADQYGSSNPLAKSIGGMFGMQMDTGQELATKEMSAIDQEAPDALTQSLAIAVKYARSPQEKMLALSQLTELQKTKTLENKALALKQSQKVADTKTRRSIAKRLEKTNPDLAAAVIEEGDSGNKDILQEAIKMLTREEKARPTTVVDAPNGEGKLLIETETGNTILELPAETPQKKADRLEEEANSFLVNKQNVMGKISLVRQSLKELAGMPFVGEEGKADWLTHVLTNIPEYSAISPNFKNMKTLITSLNANLGLDNIKELKAASKTGSTGLGAVSNIELIALQSTIANLDPTNPMYLEEGLAAVERHYNNLQASLLGGELDIDWDSAAYKDVVKLDPQTGIRYITINGVTLPIKEKAK
jgi:hypothetical protein